MTVPKWLIPVLAGIAAIAVGVAAALFAVRFAAPEDSTVTPQTLDAPLLAPVASSPTLGELVDETEGDDIPVSGAYGVGTVIDPDSVPEGGVPADVAGLIRELETADDPADVLPEAGDTTPGAPVGDPCADAEDPEALGCPPGTPGTIHALDGDLPALIVRTHSAHSDACPAAEAGSVRFIAQANAPVTITLRYNQSGYNHDLPGSTETTDAQVADWEDARAASPTGVAWIDYCLTVTGLTPDRSVNVFVRGVDALGRSATWTYSDLVSDGLDVPPTRIFPIGDSTVFASAAHTEDEVVRMFVIDRSQVESCRYGTGFASFPTVGDPATEEVSADFLTARSYEPDYTRRTSATFAVTAATQLLVCVGWFPASDGRPSFERDTPLRVSEFPMTSPDVSAPRVVVSEVETFGDVPERSAKIRATTENGQLCGYWTGPEAGETDLGIVLCDYGRLLGRYDAGGSMLLTTEVDVPEGRAVNRVLLDVSLLSCAGGCAGRTRYFDVPLSSQIRPTRICSDDCRINVGESVGIVRLEVTWPATTTGDGWVLGDWFEGPSAGTALPATPQLDLDSGFTVRPSDLAPRAFQATGSMTVDRPVLASADVVAFPGPGVTCPWPGGSTHWDGGTVPASTFTVRFDGLCAGLGHIVILTLTDPATDQTVTYTLGHTGAPAGYSWWPGAQFTTPTTNVNVAIQNARLDLGDSTRLIRPDMFDLWVGATQYSFWFPREGFPNCWFGGFPGQYARVKVVGAGETVQLQADVRFRDGTDPGRPSTDDTPTFCDAGSWADEERITFTGEVTYDQLVSLPTVTLTDPATGYTLTLTLSDRA